LISFIGAEILELEFIKTLIKPADTKIIFLVIDGLGGLPLKPLGGTELETAVTPYLDELAGEGICGLHQPVGPGVTPGSGPSHLALFGYDPIRYQIGRGVLSALGIDFELQEQDVAARGNFCTIDEKGIVKDRRAGRISTEKNRQLCEKLSQINIPDVEIFVRTVKEHRFLLVLRGQGLSDDISDTDPQQTGKEPLIPGSSSSQAGKALDALNDFVDKAKVLLSEHHPANMILLRGFARLPQWPSFQDVFGLQAAAIAGYPMYKGLAKLLGMHVLQTDPEIESELQILKKYWSDYDFFYVHVKATDSAGEDGDFDRKVKVIEKVDTIVPALRELKPDVILITGDHSTPATLRYHSWHPVPVVLWSKNCRADAVGKFDERTCISGGLGCNLPAVDLMPLILANAGRLEKFGA
jgi:2,3-bisphosphoglycerate-independent phosphoglycerate mutase